MPSPYPSFAVLSRDVDTPLSSLVEVFVFREWDAKQRAIRQATILSKSIPNRVFWVVDDNDIVIYPQVTCG